MKTITKQHVNKDAAQMVKIGTSRQVAIPKKIYEQLRLGAGDYLEAEVREDKLILTPQAFIEKRLAEGLREIEKGKVTGPFDNAKDMIKSLRAQ
jgi:AbrB family looped-hinge helix DNA binding protein